MFQWNVYGDYSLKFFPRFPVFPLTLNFDSSHLKFMQKLAETKLTFKVIFIFILS